MSGIVGALSFPWSRGKVLLLNISLALAGCHVDRSATPPSIEIRSCCLASGRNPFTSITNRSGDEYEYIHDVTLPALNVSLSELL